MAAGLILPIAGPYLASWNSLPLGTQSDDGFVISVTHQGQEVNASDAYGMTLVEGIYRGQNWRMRLRGLEWNKAGLLDLLNMFGRTGISGTFTPQLTAIGDRWSTYAKTLVMTAILGNPPSMPQSLTALTCALAPQQTTESMWTSKMKEMPIETVLLPYIAAVGSASVAVPFTTA